jgi:hypothetical protein
MYNIKVDVTDIGRGDCDWLQLTQYSVQRRALVNMVIHFGFCKINVLSILAISESQEHDMFHVAS